jgi:hypothetical protein
MTGGGDDDLLESAKKKARIERAFEFIREVSDRDQAVLV